MVPRRAHASLRRRPIIHREKSAFRDISFNGNNKIDYEKMNEDKQCLCLLVCDRDG